MANLLLHLSSSRTPLFAPSSSNPVRSRSPRKLSDSDSDSVAVVFGRQRGAARFGGLKLHAVAESDGSNWWGKNVGPNMIDAHSTEEFISILSQAGDTLVIVEFYGTWCASCRALFPKLCRTAQEHPDILFVKVDFDANKPMCKRLNVRVLPYFHFYRGADGQLESFSCSFAKFQKIKDAIVKHNTPRCSIGPPVGVGDLNLVDGPFPKSNNPAKASSK